MEVDKNILINLYGIDDDNFVDYLNKHNTVKKIINLGRVKHLPIEKIRELYNIFVYYFSLGHDLNTIVDETMPDIKRLFFFNGNGYLFYDLTGGDNITAGYSKVAIAGRICQVRIGFTAAKEIKEGDLIYDLVPAQIFEFRDSVSTNLSGDKVLRINETGIFLNEGTIPVNNSVYGDIIYIIGK